MLDIWTCLRSRRAESVSRACVATAPVLVALECRALPSGAKESLDIWLSTLSLSLPSASSRLSCSARAVAYAEDRESTERRLSQSDDPPSGSPPSSSAHSARPCLSTQELVLFIRASMLCQRRCCGFTSSGNVCRPSSSQETVVLRALWFLFVTPASFGLLSRLILQRLFVLPSGLGFLRPFPPGGGFLNTLDSAVFKPAPTDRERTFRIVPSPLLPPWGVLTSAHSIFWTLGFSTDGSCSFSTLIGCEAVLCGDFRLPRGF